MHTKTRSNGTTARAADPVARPMTKLMHRSLHTSLVLLTLAGTCAGQTAAPAPIAEPVAAPAAAITPAPASVADTAAPAPAEATKLQIFIRAMEGKSIFRRLPGNQAVPAKVGDTLDENIEVMTGPNSIVQIQVGSGQRFTIDRGSKVLIKTAISQGGKETTRLETPIGRVSFDVQRVAGDNDVEIKAPDATLAVKGTTGLIEVTPGQPTFASGGAFNTGQFNLLYNNRFTAKVTGSKASGSDRITTGKTESRNLFVDSSDKFARSGDEQKFVEDHSGQTIAPGASNKIIDKRYDYAQGASFYQMSDDGQAIARTDLGGIAFAQQVGFKGLSGSPVAGTLAANPGGMLEILTIENLPTAEGAGGSGAPTAVVRSVALSAGSFTYQTVATFRETGSFARTSWNFSGIARMGGDVYTAGTTYTDFGTKGEQQERGQIYRIVMGNSGNVPTPLMNLGIDLQRGLAGDNQRGSLFVVGSLPGTTFGFTGAATALILQVDPRINYIQNAWSNVTGQIRAGEGSPLAAVASVTGITYTSGTMIITGVDSRNNSIRVAFNPFARGGSGLITNQQLLATGLGTPRIALGNDNLLGPAPSTNLTPTNPSLPARDDINLLFSDMAYSTAARRSGVIQLIVRSQILGTAADPVGAINSGDLNILAGILGLYDNRRGGIGLTVAEFRRRILESGYRGTLPPSFQSGPPG